MSVISKRDAAVLAACIGGSIVAHQIYNALWSWRQNRRTEWVPVGRVKELYIFPIKSCMGNKEFSLFCTARGVTKGENSDRMFLIVNGENGHFYTARSHPIMVRIRGEVRDGRLHVQKEDKSIEISIETVLKQKKIVESTLHKMLRQDGYDCGDEAGEFFSQILGEKNVRLVMYSNELYSERTCQTDPDWWINDVPKRSDETIYADLAPYMITTDSSLNELNAILGREGNPIPNNQFRGNIVVEMCPAWDEDRWLDLKIGDVRLQCFKPCTRCIMTTVDPLTGEKNPDQQPLKKLSEFRLAPEGPMLKSLGKIPIFGVNAACDQSGFIHVGQVVYAKYKKSAF